MTNTGPLNSTTTNTGSKGGTGSSSNSPNNGVIAGAAVGGSVGLVLFLLLGIHLYFRRGKRSANNVVAEPSSLPVEGQAGRDSFVSNPYFHTHSRHALTAPIVVTTSSFPSTAASPSESSSAAMGHTLPSEPRGTGETAIPVTTSGQNITIPTVTSGYGSVVPILTPGHDTAASSGHNTAVPITIAGHKAALPWTIGNPPPTYQDEENTVQIIPSPRTARVQPEEEAERARLYDEQIADFCATNRDLISPSLERKLHAARYLPEDDPSDVPAEYWHNTYGVEFFELRRLQTAYERSVSVFKTNRTLSKPETDIRDFSLFSPRHRATQALINMPEKALPQAALCAKEKAMPSSS